MNDDDEFGLVKQYESLEIRRIEFANMELPSPREYGWHLQKFSKFLVNHGESLKNLTDLNSPKELAAGFAQQAINMAGDDDYDLRAAAYLSLSTARWFFSSPDHAENAILCDKAFSEATVWLNSPKGLRSSLTERQLVEKLAYTARENRALYLHYADDYKTAIDEYYTLLEEKKKTGPDEECFTLIMKLANVLNDANRYSAAKKLLFSLDTKEIATTENQRFRLYVAQSHSYALTGQMGEALKAIHSALLYFNSNAFHVETQGNLLIRAARYYIKMSAYEKAKTVMPDLIGSEGSYTGGEYALNLAVVRAMLWVAHGNNEQANNALVRLDSMVKELLKTRSTNQLPDQYWDYVNLKAQFKKRFHGNQAAITFITTSHPEVNKSTIDKLNVSHYPLLMEYCEASIKAGKSKKLQPQIKSLLCCSVFGDQWERWKAPFLAAKWFSLKGQTANAVLWSKLSCSYILSLSVPLLRYEGQRERVTKDLVSPFIFLENVLCSAARLPEAQSIRAYRLYLECEMRFPFLSDFSYQVFKGNHENLHLLPDEEIFFKKWKRCSEQVLMLLEQGKTHRGSIKSSSILKLITVAERESNDDYEQLNIEYTPSTKEKKTKNVCYLSYWVTNKEVRLIAEHATDLINIILPISPKEMRHTIHQLRIAIEEGTEWLSIASHLYFSLIAPAKIALSGANTLVFSVTDALQYLPMATLFDGNHYLVEKFELVYSHTRYIKPVTILKDAEAMFIGTRSHTTDDVKLKPERELAQIQKHFTIKTALIDLDWQQDNWKNKLNDPHSVLHLCCHFNYLPHNPAKSYLMLSNSRQLGIEDLLNIDNWDEIDCVFLATCNSAIGGSLSASNSNLSLADIFISSGVKRVIASFRPVSDTETEQFSADFYQQLRKTGSVEKSLRLAQIESIKKDNAVWSAYGCWAP